MMFFDLLPADVQIVILQTWVGTGLSSLSALDVAFCSRSRRPEFLTWMTQACHRWDLTVDSGIYPLYPLKDCVLWLAARNLIPFELGLRCCCRQPSDSTAGTTVGKLLHKTKEGNIGTQEAHEILAHCSQLASVRYYSSYRMFKEELDPTQDENFFIGLASVPLINLENLSIDSNIPLPMDLVSSALQAVGSKLLKLNLHVYTDDINRLFDLIIEHCKVLRHFAFEEAIVVVEFMALPSELHVEHLVRVVTGIPSLISLKLDHTIRAQDLFPVLRQIRSLESCHEDDNYEEFVGLLEQFPQLDTLDLREHKFCRDDGSLWCTSANGLGTCDWFRCVVACPAIRTLTLSLTLVRGNEIAMACIGEAYGATLEIVHLQEYTTNDLLSIETLLSHCSTLSTLIVSGKDEQVCRSPLLRIMGSKCRLLKYISLQGRVGDAVVEDDMPLITDADMEKLCINCPKLSMLVLHGQTNITSQTLDTFIRLKMRFKHIQFSSSTFNITEADVDEFKRQVKEHGLVPMPSEVWLLSPVEDFDIDI